MSDPNLLDIAPTALDLFGVEVPRYMQGRNLFGQPAQPVGHDVRKEPELVATK